MYFSTTIISKVEKCYLFYQYCVSSYVLFRLVVKLLSMVQRQYLLLKGVGLATDELTEEYNNVIETVENGREVMWADQSLKDSDDGDKQSFIINCQSTTFGKL